MLGTPSEEDRSFVTDQKAIDYLSSYKVMARVDLGKKFPGISKEGIDFLDKLLQFNPFFRLSLDEAINHPFFKDFKKDSGKTKGSKVKLDFEDEDLDLNELRKLFKKELKHYENS